MIIVWGNRHFGKVDAHGGQYAATRFFHLWYLPLIPGKSFWFTGPRTGHPMKLRAGNVAAGYARVWGPVTAIGGAVVAIASSSIGAVPVAVAGLAAALWSRSRKQLRDPREQKRSDLHLVAFGTRCDPLDWDEELVARVRPRVTERWAALAAGKTPDDVATRGTDDPRQAIAAYGVLRLAARERPEARAASERVLDNTGAIDPSALEGGPYRALETKT